MISALTDTVARRFYLCSYFTERYFCILYPYRGLVDFVGPARPNELVAANSRQLDSDANCSIP